MTKQTAQQYLPLIKAFAEGKTLQYKPPYINKWHDATDLSFALEPERYRIKPEPIKQEFYYVVLNGRPSVDPYGVCIYNIYKYGSLDEVKNYLKQVDPEGEKYVIMHAKATSVEETTLL